MAYFSFRHRIIHFIIIINMVPRNDQYYDIMFFYWENLIIKDLFRQYYYPLLVSGVWDEEMDECM